MPDFDAEGFVAAVERLRLLLTAVPLADGSVRLNRWRTPDAVIHAQRIEALWPHRSVRARLEFESLQLTPWDAARNSRRHRLSIALPPARDRDRLVL
jgi:hypothetical protein